MTIKNMKYMRYFLVCILVANSNTFLLAPPKIKAGARTYSLLPETEEKKPYKAQRTTKSSFYNPDAETFDISRSKLEDYVRCALCSITDRKYGVGAPPGFPFTLNNAVDETMKRRFDIHRAAQTVDPYCQQAGIHAIPFQHPDIDKWRNQLSGGLSYTIPGTNLTLKGAPDDIWIDKEKNELYVVDYKATSKQGELELHESYKRQITVYQYLLRKMQLKNAENQEYTVSKTGYFVYTNAKKTDPFNDTLTFKTEIIPSRHSDRWIEPTMQKMYQSLQCDTLPEPTASCSLCQYRLAASMVERQLLQNNNAATNSKTSSSQTTK